MPTSVTTVSDGGFASTSTVREFSVDIDPRGEAAPDTIESLLAAYAACFIPALRVTAEREDLGSLGRVEIDVEGDLDEDGKLEASRFDIELGADLDADERDRLIAGARSLCKVHATLRDPLKAAVAVNGADVA
ncbi:MAG: OsmC family protein [Halobacteriales archaeon]